MKTANRHTYEIYIDRHTWARLQAEPVDHWRSHQVSADARLPHTHTEQLGAPARVAGHHRPSTLYAHPSAGLHKGAGLSCVTPGLPQRQEGRGEGPMREWGPMEGQSRWNMTVGRVWKGEGPSRDQGRGWGGGFEVQEWYRGKEGMDKWGEKRVREKNTREGRKARRNRGKWEVKSTFKQKSIGPVHHLHHYPQRPHSPLTPLAPPPSPRFYNTAHDTQPPFSGWSYDPLNSDCLRRVSTADQFTKDIWQELVKLPK